MTTIRQYYDTQDITLEPTGQLFPLCLPAGGDDAVFDWDPAGGVCVNPYDEYGWGQPYCEHASGSPEYCALMNCTWTADDWDPQWGWCEGDALGNMTVEEWNAQTTAECSQIGVREDCRNQWDEPPGFCEWDGNGGVATDEDRFLAKFEVPLSNAATTFSLPTTTFELPSGWRVVLDGSTYTCPEYTCIPEDERDDDRPYPWPGYCLPLTDYSEQNGALVKCVSTYVPCIRPLLLSFPFKRLVQQLKWSCALRFRADACQELLESTQGSCMW
jgi:uncharacterized protein YbdZ (MbtH family)